MRGIQIFTQTTQPGQKVKQEIRNVTKSKAKQEEKGELQESTEQTAKKSSKEK